MDDDQYEWGVRYLDGKTMKRFNRQVAEDAVRLIQGRVLMYRRPGTAQWHECGLRAAG